MATDLNQNPHPDLVDVPASRVNNTNLFQVIWQRKSLVVLGLVIGLVLGSLYYAKRPRVYQTQAQLLVVKKSPDVGLSQYANAATAGFMDDYMSTQTQILRSQPIAETASKSKKFKDLLEGGGRLKAFPDVTKPDDLWPHIAQGLTVTRENRETTAPTGNSVLVLSYRCNDTDDCKDILDAVIAAYQVFLDETYRDINDSAINRAIQERKDLEKRIEETEKARTEFINTCPPHLVPIISSGGAALQQREAVRLREEISTLETRLRLIKHQLQTIKDFYAKHHDNPREVVQYILRRGYPLKVTGDEKTDEEVRKLKLLEMDLSAKWGPNHPDVKAMQNRIEYVKNIYTEKAPDSPTKAAIEPGTSDKETTEQFIEYLEDEVRIQTKLVEREKAAEEATLTEERNGHQTLLKYEQLKGEVDRARAMHNVITQKVEMMNLASGRERNGYNARVLYQPGPGRQVAPNPYQTYTAASLIGLLLGVGLAYLAEVSDKSFRNPVEIRRRLGLPVIGHVPFLAADEKAAQLVSAGSSTLDPMLITHYQSNSIGAEAYRGVRTALYFSTEGANHQVIQVTSPNVSDGKSTLAANLAVSIAQSGKRTLLIDGDFRKPRVHKIFNVPAQVGMASVMVGQAELATAIQQSVIPNLSILPCGPRPVNPAELLTSPRFKEVIDELRKLFDIVIVDTPPVLVVTDPMNVAPRVDGVVLCIRVTKNGRPFAERACEILASHRANVLGVVVNGFGAQVGGNRYGYDNYQYGYGEGYTYTYGYTYADKDAASYYATNVDEAATTTKS